jgi:hypothetical protein
MAYEDGAGGLEAFVATIEHAARQNQNDKQGRRRFVAELGSLCAGIHTQNMFRHPIRFLREMQGNPPLRFGEEGFRPEVIDDVNPARHYMAFVLVGFWLPMVLGIPVLYAWEVASFFRYKGHWSPKDIHSGMIGLRHGREVAHGGTHVLAPLARRDLGAESADQVSLT